MISNGFTRYFIKSKGMTIMSLPYLHIRSQPIANFAGFVGFVFS
jgi:hypothetical protein